MVTEKQKANLIPVNKRTPRERSEIGRKGAEASNKAKREKRKWKDILTIMLSTSADDKAKEVLKSFGIDNATLEDVILLKGLVQPAVKGDLNAIRELKELTVNKEATEIKFDAPMGVIIENEFAKPGPISED